MQDMIEQSSSNFSIKDFAILNLIHFKNNLIFLDIKTVVGDYINTINWRLYIITLLGRLVGIAKFFWKFALYCREEEERRREEKKEEERRERDRRRRMNNPVWDNIR